MRSSIMYAVIAFALCIGVLIAYGMWYTVIEAKSTAVVNLQNQIDTKRETASRTASARAALSEIAGDEAAVRSYFVPETGVVAFINDLEARGNFQKAVVSVLSVAKEGTSARPTFMFTISIKGAFDAVMRTIGTIEYAPYALSLSTLSLIQVDKNLWHADIKLLVGSVSTTAVTSTATP